MSLDHLTIDTIEQISKVAERLENIPEGQTASTVFINAIKQGDLTLDSTPTAIKEIEKAVKEFTEKGEDPGLDSLKVLATFLKSPSAGYRLQLPYYMTIATRIVEESVATPPAKFATSKLQRLLASCEEFNPLLYLCLEAALYEKLSNTFKLGKWVKRGSFVLTGTELVVIDPCYKDLSGEVVVRHCQPGVYGVYSMHKDIGGIAPAGLAVARKFEEIKDSRVECHRRHWDEYGIVGVDSGQAGIFTKDGWRNDSLIGQRPFFCGTDKALEPGDLFYGACCDATGYADRAELCPGVGVLTAGCVSRSGHGDGAYTVYNNADHCSTDGNSISALILDFTGDYW